MGAFSRPQPKSRFFQKSGIIPERSEIKMVPFTKCSRTFDANELTWKDLAIPGVDGRMHVIAYEETPMEDFTNLINATFIGAFIMLAIIAVLRLARNITRWFYRD